MERERERWKTRESETKAGAERERELRESHLQIKQTRRKKKTTLFVDDTIHLQLL